MTTQKEKTTIQSNLGFYFVGLIIGAVSGFYWALLPFGGPTIGFVVANSLRSTPQEIARHGLVAGIIGAIGQVIAFIFSMGGFARFQQSDLSLLIGIAAWTILSCVATSAIVGRRRRTPEEIAAARTRHAAEAEKRPASLEVATTTGILSFPCPSCGFENQVSLSAFSGSGSSQDKRGPQVIDSGRSTKVPTRLVNIIIYVLVALGAGICSGNLLVSVIVAMFALSTTRYWAAPVANIFGASTPIWLIKCPRCGSTSEAVRHMDTVNPTFAIALADEEK